MKEIGEGYCLHCLKKTQFLSLSKRYKIHCNMSCSIRDSLTQTKMKENCKKKTGYEHIMQDPEYRKTWEENFNKIHGVINPGQKFRNEESFKKTCNELYGGCGLASESIRKKYEETNLENTGNMWSNNPTKQKETNLKRHGVEYTINKEYIQKLFNVDNVSQLEEIKNKKEETCKLHYGVTNPSKSKLIRDKKKRKYTYNGINFDSSWEIVFYIYLTDHNVRFEYHPIDFEYYCPIDKQIHKYEVDFKLFNNTFIEIKGGHLLEKMKIDVNSKEHYKYLCMLENNVKIITDCGKYLKYVINTYGKNYLNTFKNKGKINEK